MTDSEKIALIDGMISDWWGNTAQEDLEKGGMHIVSAIYSVVNFKVNDE